MKLTPFSKLLVALIILGAVGYVAYQKYGNEIRAYATKGAGKVEDVSKDDFNKIGRFDAPRDGKVEVTAPLGPGGDMLNRPPGGDTRAGHRWHRPTAV
jgi:hypothetical protein